MDITNRKDRRAVTHLVLIRSILPEESGP